jgi:hypothetical protein
LSVLPLTASDYLCGIFKPLYCRGNQKPLEEEQTIHWLKDTTEVIRSREEEQIIQWFKDTTEVARSREEEHTIHWLKYTKEVIRSREEEQIIQWFKDTCVRVI